MNGLIKHKGPVAKGNGTVDKKITCKRVAFDQKYSAKEFKE